VIDERDDGFDSKFQPCLSPFQMSTYPIIEAFSMQLLGRSCPFLATPPSQLISCAGAEQKVTLLSLLPVHPSCSCPIAVLHSSRTWETPADSLQPLLSLRFSFQQEAARISKQRSEPISKWRPCDSCTPALKMDQGPLLKSSKSPA
jgi:hypothetical protein